MSEKNLELCQLIALSARRISGIMYEGFSREDQNLPGHLMIVESPSAVYSFPKQDILESETMESGRVRVWIRPGANAFRMTPFLVGRAAPFIVGMEEILPPSPKDDPDAPRTGKAEPISPRTNLAAVAGSLSGVASTWSNSCAGGDTYENNCAHFLSDALIRAGFTELLPPNSHINARCGTSAKRPIRARDMWSWFQAKATRTSRTPVRNTGWWAVFQLKESVYWGGHVVVLDSNSWECWGTGWYGDWDQYLYQW